MWNSVISIVIFVTLPLCVSIALITDAFKMIIPNSVSLALLGIFFAVSYPSGLNSLQFMMHLAAGTLVLVVGLILYFMRQMGAGDVKLLSCCAVWFGLGEPLLIFLFLVSIIGALLVFAIAALRSSRVHLEALFIHFPKHIMEGGKIPYGIAICSAALIVFPETEIMKLAITQMAST